MSEPDFTLPYGWRLDLLNPTGDPTRLIGVPICPDLLDHAALGAADNTRGRIVRAFFWLLRAWPT